MKKKGEKNMKKNKNNVLLVIGLVLLFVVIGVGYASLSQQLKIRGTANIGKSTWNVHFENVQVASGSVTANPAPYAIGNSTDLTYTVSLDEPGDYYEFTVDVVNDGSLSAALQSQTLTGGEDYNFIIHEVKMVSGANLVTVPSNLVLAPAGQSGDSITLNVKVSYDRDLADPDYINADIDPISLQYIMNFEQA